jgi:hypothetical protein
MAKRKKQSFRDLSTDDAIIKLLAANSGDMTRRDIVRKFGHRGDLVAALHRLARRKEIESVRVQQRGKRPVERVRLIGVNAVAHGAGYLRLGGGK